MTSITEEHQQLIMEAAREAAREAVVETLLLLGIDVSTPEAIERFRKDQLYTREWRLSVEAIKSKSMLTAVSFLTAAFVGWALMSVAKMWHPIFP